MQTRVLQDQFTQTVMGNIRDGAILDLPYIFMNILAAVIASYGLLANSPAVVIGAMIVALLLGPIAAVALALVDGDSDLLRKALLALSAGTAVVIMTGLILGFLHKDIPITDEIMARTSPSLMDLMVALAGGAAGAYASVSPRLSTALVGVAIATALVPPLCAGCILLARGEYQLAYGAFLLTFTNMVAIQFAASVVLLLCGYGGISQNEKLSLPIFLKRNFVSISLMLILGVVLTANLIKVVRQQIFESSTRSILTRIVDNSAGSHEAEVRFQVVDNTTIIRAVVRGPAPPSAAQVAEIESQLPPTPDGTKTELRIRFVETIVMNRDGRMFQGEGFQIKE